VILVDPPIREEYYSSEEKDPERDLVYFPSKPFLGPYEDFMDPPSIIGNVHHRERTSDQGLSQDLEQYWKRSIPSCFNPQDPSIHSLAYYPLRIVAAEWVKYVAVMHTSIKHYEYSSNKLPDFLYELEKLNCDLRALQSWRRRSLLSQQKVRSVIRSLKARIDTASDLQALTEDFEFISVNIEESGLRLESMLPVVTSLVQIVNARRSFAETANITRLTFLALVFIPLNYISSLFSMNPINAPGSHYFWMYFVVAVPVTLLVFLIARPPRSVIQKLSDWVKSRTIHWASLRKRANHNQSIDSKA
jgi:CorA-like Mg2+ transporter protein